MAELGLTQGRNPAIGKGADADSLVRSVLLGAVFLTLWISFRPFRSLADPTLVDDTGNFINQVGYSLLFVLLAAWCMVHQPSRLALLVRPVLIAALLWLALSIIFSQEPMLSARRLAYTFVTLGIAGMALLLPKNIRHFSEVLTAVVLIVLVVSYLGVFLIPSLAVHQAGDFDEFALAGAWRGVFGHKDAAAAAMVAFVFIGLFIARMRSVVVGAAIVALALIFLLFTHSKAWMVTLPLALIISIVMARSRRPILGIAFALSVLVGLNIFSVGSVYFEPVRNLLNAVLTDTSFTGRNEVWQFAVDHIKQRPLTGYGYAAFWGTPEVVYGHVEHGGWAATAGHAHNAYLDLALTIGIPGAILVILWLVVLPLIDFYRSPQTPQTKPLQLLFLRICLSVIYASSFDSMLSGEGSVAMLLFAATFGLRFLSVSRAAV